MSLKKTKYFENFLPCINYFLRVIWLAEITLRHFRGSISWKRENAALRFGQSDNPKENTKMKVTESGSS